MPRFYSRQGSCSTHCSSPASHRFSGHPYRRESVDFDRGIMEESAAERKQRLAAMRIEASEGGGNPLMVSQSLANPLIEQPNMSPEPHAAPRFDYYTDPMAAFLPNKRGNKVSHQISPDFTNHHPSPAHQGLISPAVQTTPNPGHFQAQGPYNNPGQISYPAQQFNSSPEFRPFQAQGPYYNPGPLRSPAQQPNYPPGSIPYQAQGPYYDPRPFRSPAQQPNYPPGSNTFQAQGPYYNPGPFVNPGPMGTPDAYNMGPRSVRPDAYNMPPDAYNMPPGSVNHWGRPSGSSPNFVPNASFNHGQGSRPNFNHGQGGRPNFNHGQGRGYNNSGRGVSSGPGGNGSHSFQQSGSHNAVSAGFNPRKYCKKSMVEDPWKGLKPVLLKQSSSSWLPKSLTAKKPRVSEAPPVKKESGQSLAEYLAASFHEATNETDDNDDDNDDRLNV